MATSQDESAVIPQQPRGAASSEIVGQRYILGGSPDKIAVTSNQPGTARLREVHKTGVDNVRCSRPVHHKNELRSTRVDGGSLVPQLTLLAAGDPPIVSIQSLECACQLALGVGIERPTQVKPIWERAAPGNRPRLYLVDEKLIVLRGVGVADALGNIGDGRGPGCLLE